MCAVVAESRLATVAIIVQLTLCIYWSAKKLPSVLRITGFIFILAVTMSLASMVNPRFDRIGNTVASTFSGIQANEVTGNARAKVLIGSYLIFSEAPLVGYGAFGALEKLEDLGVVRFAGSANQKTLPLHGSITSILLAGGLLSVFFIA